MVGIFLTLLAALLGMCLAFIDSNPNRASMNLTAGMRMPRKEHRKRLG